MLTKRELLQSGAVAEIGAAETLPSPAPAQILKGTPAAPNLTYSTTKAPGVAAETTEPQLGTLDFFDGFPYKVSADKRLDNRNFHTTAHAKLLAIPGVSQVADRNTCLHLAQVIVR